MRALRFATLGRRALAPRVGSGLLAARAAPARCFGATASCASEKAFGMYPGDAKIPFVSDLEFSPAEPEERWPAFRLMEEDGSFREGVDQPDLTREELTEMYTTMVRLQAMDQIFYDAQRQGRISFYMTSSGEEGTHVGCAHALDDGDMIFGQYRETGVLMHRGFTLQQFADQCFSNDGDPAKGRQMPVHYGSKTLNFQTISSPLATQIPQATGAAYKCKLDGEGKCVVVFFGDGAASEGDFHPALNFAATLDCPVIFFCRNNGYAISTPVKDQYRGDGIVSRGPGYGISSIRVDGNDTFAVYAATKRAREIAVKENRPVLIEAMSYRQGHHSTSDDSTRYRDVDEIQSWRDNDNPLTRLRLYMESQGWWDEARETSLKDTEKRKVLEALSKAENKPDPSRDTMFDDVYDIKPQHLIDQEREMLEHIAKYPDKYNHGH